MPASRAKEKVRRTVGVYERPAAWRRPAVIAAAVAALAALAAGGWLLVD